MSASHALLVVSALLAIPIAICSRTHRRFFLDVLCPVLTMTAMVALLATLTWSFVEDHVIGEAEVIARTGAVVDEPAAAAEPDSSPEALGEGEIAGVAYVQALAVFARRRRE